LGLAVVYGIVKSHDGFIEVTSQPQHGTTFRLYFPIVSSVHERLWNANLTSSSQAKPRQNTILIVEDELLMLRLLERFFLQHGYHILVASDGEQAVEIYRSYKSRSKGFVDKPYELDILVEVLRNVIEND
jgi:hypothetical protein